MSIAKYTKQADDGQTSIPVKVEDFIISEDNVINEKSKEKEFRRGKYKAEEEELMDEALEDGRAAPEEDLKRFHLPGMGNAGLVSSVFGRSMPIRRPAPDEATGTEGSSASHDAENKRLKAFDAGMEKLALQQRLLQSTDREITSLLNVQNDVDNFLQEFHATPGAEDELPGNEREAMALMTARRTVSKALVGRYTEGMTSVSVDDIEHDVAV